MPGVSWRGGNWTFVRTPWRLSCGVADVELRT